MGEPLVGPRVSGPGQLCPWWAVNVEAERQEDRDLPNGEDTVVAVSTTNASNSSGGDSTGSLSPR
jgi:hypothetical protein